MNASPKNFYIFGYGLSLIMAFFSWSSAAHYNQFFVSFILFFLAVVCGLMTRLKVQALTGIYSRWMRVALLIGTFVMTVALGFLYYLVFSVAGIVTRLFKKDLLNQQIEPEKTPYWKKRGSTSVQKEESLR